MGSRCDYLHPWSQLGVEVSEAGVGAAKCPDTGHAACSASELRPGLTLHKSIAGKTSNANLKITRQELPRYFCTTGAV